MRSKKINNVLVKSLLIFLILGSIPKMVIGETISVFYNPTTPPHAFAAGDIKTALEAKNFTVEIKDLSTLADGYTGKKVVIALASNAQVTALLTAQGGSAATSLSEQAYALRTTTASQLSYWVLGGDDNGAMYGALQIAENINFNGFAGSYDEQVSPHLRYRGIKFNIPFDKDMPTYFFHNGGTSHKEAIRHVWDLDFWKTWFDEMARHRYNVLSLWSPHPFTSMVKMDDYPDLGIQGVEGYDKDGDPVQINDMSIDDKIKFWKQVMKYGRDRGFGIYFCTWNIFLDEEDEKWKDYSISDDQDDRETRTYIKKCLIKFLETYPDLAGFGVTAGERMEGNANDKEEWLWDTYGRGMKEYAQANPNRNLVFIHRHHQSDMDDVLKYFKQLNDLPNVRFDLSFKYSKAHAHSTLTPDFGIDRFVEALDENKLKTWFTVRNDDFYFLHWGDPKFVRDYIANFPDVNKYVHAFYIGADGWVFTRAFTNKDSYYKDKNALSIQKTWYMQKLWGRISYNPSISDELFKNHLAYKYPEASSEDLFQAWSKASRAIVLANEQVTGPKWQLDFHWWPEGWSSKDGFRNLDDTRNTQPMKGSNLCSFKETAEGKCGSKISAITTADKIETLASDAIEILETINPGANTELNLNLKDLHAMANLSLYCANKYRAAIYLEQGKRSDARDVMGRAYCYWETYINLMDELYISVDLQRNNDLKSWHQYDDEALKDYTDLGGNGKPDCSN